MTMLLIRGRNVPSFAGSHEAKILALAAWWPLLEMREKWRTAFGWRPAEEIQV
jgi:hypothetical protein